MNTLLKPNPNKGVVKVQNTYNPAFHAMFNSKAFNQVKKPGAASNKSATSSNSKVTPGTDAALAALQSSLALENAKKQGNT